LLLQAILRHPAVAVFGTSAEPFVIEGAIAAFVFVVLLVLLGSIYRNSRPLLQGLAWTALDSLFATRRSEQAPEAAETIQPVLTPTVAPPPESNATVVAPSSSATIVAPASGATVTRVAAKEESNDETLPDPARIRG
jgi:hypothetical protein